MSLVTTPLELAMYVYHQLILRPLDNLLVSKGAPYKARYAWMTPYMGTFLKMRGSIMRHGFYPFPKQPPWVVSKNCGKCSQPATFWCIECKLRFCADCCARNHHPGQKTKYHSVEAMLNPKKQGARLFQTVVSSALVIGSLVYVLSNLQLSPDYLTQANICPITSKARSLAAALDTKIFYYYKSDFVKYCNIEDSFYKLFLDGWVRGIVTNSDDTLLVLSSLAPAYVLSTVLSAIVAPIIAVVYALLMTLAHTADSYLPQEKLQQIGGYLQANAPTVLSFLQSLDMSSMWGGCTQAPPLTKWRVRIDFDFYDRWKYQQSRRTRFTGYFFDHAKDTMKWWSQRAVPYVAMIRLLLIWVPSLAKLLRSALSLLPVVGAIVKTHQGWFQDAVSHMLFTEQLSLLVITKSKEYAFSLLGFMPFAGLVGQFSMMFSAVLIVMIAGYLIFNYIIMLQQKAFDASSEKEIWGPCVKAGCPCSSAEFFRSKEDK